MDTSPADAIVNALQQLTIATYDSLRRFDQTYSFDTYRAGLKLLESKGQVKRLVFRVGKSTRCAWLLPWYEDEALEKLQEFKNDAIEYLATTPSTGRQIKEYFKQKYPAFHQIAYLAFRELVSNKNVSVLAYFDNLRSINIYYLPERKSRLDELLRNALDYVEHHGSAYPHDINEPLGVDTRLAYALLAALAHEGKVFRFKVGWSYSRQRPVYAYCKEGHEAEAVVRYRRAASRLHAQLQHSRLMETYSRKFSAACTEMNTVESLADLAASYFERAVESHWIRGRDSMIVAWSAFFLANKILRQGITPGEIEGHTKIERRLLLTVSKDLNDFLQLDVPDLYPNPSDYLERIASRMALPRQLESLNGLIETNALVKETNNFLISLPKTLFFGKRGESMAAAALYLTGLRLGIEECTQKRISKAADVTEVTIRNIIKQIESAVPHDGEAPLVGATE
jgi:transcription initiation factor TFIIIB Brf1 subunit/transcription initiation factor TFIIB